MKRVLPVSLGITLLILLGLIFISGHKVTNVSAAAATHIVISEIQTSGALTTDDFIELYNPTNSDINLGDFRLVKRTSGGVTDTSIVAFTASDIIPAHGYFLWCNSNLAVALTCDRSTAESIANNNSVALRGEPVDTGLIVDAVTFGTVTNTLGEGTSLTAPSASTSVERKANTTSTNTSMAIGGLDEFLGNAEDTDNNLSDFVNRSIPQAQNSASALEPIGASPTPTVEPSLVPSVTPSVAPSPTPTLEPTATPVPTEAPSPTPTVTLAPSPTSAPSPTPTITQAPSPTLTQAPSPTVQPTAVPSNIPSVTQAPSPTPIVSPFPPTPTPKIISRGPIITCTMTYKPWHFFNKTYFLPVINCARTSI